MKIIVTGATGMVGAELIRQSLLDKDIELVTALIRRPLPMQHEKLRQVLHQDFLQYTGLDPLFREHDACLWCLGISQSRVSKEQYTAITYHYTVAAAKAMLAANAEMGFGFLSGEGADTTEKSRVRFAKVKGHAENALTAMPFKHLWIFRPGGIRPVNRNPDEGLYKRFEILAVRLMRALAPSSVIDTDILSIAMLNIVKKKLPQVLYRHGELKRLGSTK